MHSLNRIQINASKHHPKLAVHFPEMLQPLVIAQGYCFAAQRLLPTALHSKSLSTAVAAPVTQV
eukprot:3936387-Rhodomonas_salina.2